MKTNLFLAACVIFFCYSCTKKGTIKPNTPLTYAITANVDGKEETFDSGDSVRNIGTTGVYITGVNDTSQDRIQLYAYNYSIAFTPGIYTDTTKAGVSNSQILFYPAGDYTNYYYSYYIAGTYNYPSFVTVSTLTDTNIQGTFSGSVVLVNYISGTAALSSKTLTNGKFNISFKH